MGRGARGVRCSATVVGMEQLDVVMSGFDSYQGIDVNPSRLVVEQLAQQGVPTALDGVSIRVTSAILPMSFSNAWTTLLATLDEVHPQIVIATGLKRRCHGIALERCATNLMDADKPDADNVQPRREPIDPAAPAAYWTQLPLRGILNAFASREIPATLSSDAGTYVCNSLFYRLLNWSNGQQNVLAGFLSFPKINDAGDWHIGIPLSQMVEAAQTVVESAAGYYVHTTANALEAA